MDPFTQRLLERTKASRSKLEAKLSNTPQPLPRKRRSPLQDNILLEKEPQISPDDDFSLADDSPGKRQCVESKTIRDDLKENKPQSKTILEETRIKPSSVTTKKQETKCYSSLSAENKFDVNEGGDIKQKRANRLAKLAAHINSWEDDSKESTFKYSPTKSKASSSTSLNEEAQSPSKIHKTNSKSSVTSAKNEDTDAVDGCFAQEFDDAPVILLGVTKSPDKSSPENACAAPVTPKATPRRRSSSFSVSSTPNAPPIIARKKSFNAEKRSTRTIVWDQAVVATLEAQGFVQSPSKSKLEYKFNAGSVKTSKKRVSDSSSSSVDSSSDSSSEDDAKRLRKVEPKKTPVQIEEPGRMTVKKLAEKFAVPFVAPPKGPQKDPADLPLSARVALFESQAQANSNATPVGPSKKPVNTCSATKQRAISPQKTPAQQPSKESPEKKSVADIISKFSPTKAVGSHTVELHRKLFENAQSWKDNEISQKIKENREKDMEVVLNRWTHRNKQAAEDAARAVTNQRIAAHSTPFKEPTKPVLASKDLSPVRTLKEPPVPPPMPPLLQKPSPHRVSFAPSDSDTGSSPSASSANSYTESLSETESDDEPLQYLDPDVDSEEELNRALAVVDAICTEDDDDVGSDLDSSILKEAFQKIEPVRPVYIEKPFKVPAVPEPRPQKIKEEPRSDDERSDSLLHTISFYRRQKETTRFTVLKSVVRNEIEPSSSDSRSSNDEDELETSAEQLESVQERIKNLQEEINVQQAVMRQASQALFLCRSHETFQGSLEQIEGERLLLVAAEKRQACLSEIERLKTDGALRTLSPSKCSRGSLSMGDMKLMLKKEFLEQTANGTSGDFVHFFIVLIKHRAQVIATQMMSTMDGISASALHFPNLINIRNLDRDFNVIVEVYGLQTKRDCVNRELKSMSLKKDKGSKLTLTPRKRQSKKDLKMIGPKVQSPGGPNVICTSSFALIGSTAINLKTLNRKTWHLEKIPFVSPLEGSLIMKVRCYSDFSNEEHGFLTMFDDVGGFGAWHRRWFVLSDRTLSYWKYPDDVKQKAPIGQIDLRQCITSDVCLVPRDICARPHTFMLLIVRPPSKENTDSLVVHNFKSYATVKVLLSADTKEERISWCQLVNKSLENLRTWDPEALRPIPENFEGFK